jgi:predicted nucleotidyltransferase
MSAVDFLFSKGMQKVLSQVYADPERDFTLSDLLANAPGGRGNNQRHIENFLDVGVLVEGERRGRQRCIKANKEYFLYEELRSIASKTFSLKEPLTDALMPFRHQIVEAFVFGSIAKNTDTSRSDVDLIVVGDAPMMEISEAIANVEKTLMRPVNMSLYSAQEWTELVETDPVVAQIAKGKRMEII